MRHDIHLHGEAFGLRPVEMRDAAFIVALRSDPAVSRFIHETSPDLGEQERWLQRYFERAGDYYFVIERLAAGSLEGTASIYDVDDRERSAEWGRWIVRPGSLAAVESAWLTYRIAFDVLNLEMVYCRTIVANQRVVSFHTSCGLVTHRRLVAHVRLGGQRTT